MDIKKLIIPMQKIEFIESDPLTQEVKSYHSRVEEISEKSIQVAEPYGKGHLLQRRYQLPYTVRLVVENSAYVFQTRLINYLNNTFPLWVISLPTAVEKNQLRDYVRLSVNLDVILTILPISEVSEEEKESEHGESNVVQLKTITRDISGSGLCVISPEGGLATGAILQIQLQLSRTLQIQAEGEVQRFIVNDNDKKLVGINFTQITENDRRALIQFIYKKQIARRKKEAQLFE